MDTTPHHYTNHAHVFAHWKFHICGHPSDYKAGHHRACILFSDCWICPPDVRPRLRRRRRSFKNPEIARSALPASLLLRVPRCRPHWTALKGNPFIFKPGRSVNVFGCVNDSCLPQVLKSPVNSLSQQLHHSCYGFNIILCGIPDHQSHGQKRCFFFFFLLLTSWDYY